MKTIIKSLIAIGTLELRHTYDGQCPDMVDGHDQRDPNCPACQVLIAAESLGEFCTAGAVNLQLLEALKTKMGRKSCGHDFDCICADDMARAVIKAAENELTEPAIPQPAVSTNRLYVYQMTSGPMAQPPAEPMTFNVRADSKEEADILAERDAAKLKGKFVFVKSI